MRKYKSLIIILWLVISISGFVCWGAKVKPSPPVYEFEIKRDWLTMSDGVRLSVTYFKPIVREKDERFPVLFEFLPYRKDDLFYLRDYPIYSYFARRGYVMAKVDIRGTGSSEGRVPPREYSEPELEDAVDIIGQLSRAPWSNGNVGMWGISWGGFNAIQVAMRRPHGLKAILALDASDDLYHDDVHYIDGAFHVDQYEVSIDTDLGLPRWPDYALDKDYFEERFNAYPWFLTYLKQQKDGDFWRKNSLCWNYRAIQVPSYLIGGLLDGYRDSVPRMLENMKVPIKAVIGPWTHAWPDTGEPGPNYEWRHEAVRWWDYWLKDRDTGIMDEPKFVVFVRDGHPPDAYLKMTPGYWRYEDWPIKRTLWKKFYPDDGGRLQKSIGEANTERLQYVPSYGIAAGYWWGEPTGDMRRVDAGSLVYDSEVLTDKMEIIGFPRIKLKVSADAKLAHWIARLEDVHPDGRVSLVTGALINGSQHRSRLNPEYLIPGQIYELDFSLHFTTWTFKPGHRIRLAVSNSLFPMIWPTPYRMTTQLFLGSEATSLELPVIPFKDSPVPEFLPSQPKEERPDAWPIESKGWPFRHRAIQDLIRSITTVELEAVNRWEIQGRRYQSLEKVSYQTDDTNPANSSFRGEGGHIIQLEERTLHLKVFVSIHSDEKNFYVKFTRQIFEGEKLIRERHWEESIQR
ncbi:MAG: CocE/NonD family hydrolase, partial [Candidatus Aminicenantes bacterium]|nr:CocE/NonD family hydrolase [Candidatus Aminicenantes bacterium]